MSRKKSLLFFANVWVTSRETVSSCRNTQSVPAVVELLASSLDIVAIICRKHRYTRHLQLLLSMRDPIFDDPHPQVSPIAIIYDLASRNYKQNSRDTCARNQEVDAIRNLASRKYKQNTPVTWRCETVFRKDTSKTVFLKCGCKDRRCFLAEKHHRQKWLHALSSMYPSNLFCPTFILFCSDPNLFCPPLIKFWP